MKENSKEKLERQLNENPELKERFNLQMEGIVNSIKTNTNALTITNVLSIEQFKEIGKLYNNRESDYNSLHNEKRELLKHRGIYAPKYAFEFLDWFFDCYLFGKPMHVKEDEGLSLYHFQLYNEYVNRLFEHKNWTDDKEREFLNKQSQGSNPDSKGSKPKKQGRPKTVIHEASYYLHNKELLQFLIDNYSNTTPQIFNQLLSVLADIEVNQLKPATKKEYKEAFGKALNVRQRQSNFDNYFNTIKIDEIFKPIKATIKTYLNGN